MQGSLHNMKWNEVVKQAEKKTLAFCHLSHCADDPRITRSVGFC